MYVPVWYLKKGFVITDILCKTLFISFFLYLCAIFTVMFLCIWGQGKYPYIKHVQNTISIFILYALFALKANSFFILLLGLVALSLSNHSSFKRKRIWYRSSILFIFHLLYGLCFLSKLLLGEKSGK